MVTLKPMFGPEQTREEQKVAIQDVRLFAENTLLQYLPKRLREGLGAGISLKPADHFPWQLTGSPGSILARRRYIRSVIKKVEAAGKKGRLKPPGKGKGRGKKDPDSDGASSVNTLSVLEDQESELGSVVSRRSDVGGERDRPERERGRGGEVRRGDVARHHVVRHDGQDGREAEQQPANRKAFWKRMTRRFRRK